MLAPKVKWSGICSPASKLRSQFLSSLLLPEPLCKGACLHTLMRAWKITQACCVCVCTPLSSLPCACPTARRFPSLKMGVPAAHPQSAPCSRLRCLSDRQELVSSVDNPLPSLQRLLGTRRLFLPLPHFAGLQVPSKQRLFRLVMDAGQAARESEAAQARLKQDGGCYRLELGQELERIN